MSKTTDFERTERTRELLGVPPPARLKARAEVVRRVRQFLQDREYMDVEPPAVVPACGLEIHISALEVTVGAVRGYLHTSPELAMKKLLGCGYERIYSLGKVWRAGEVTERHNVEFTLLEWYRAGFSARELMDETEALVRFAAPVAVVQEPFRRWRVADAFRECAGIDFDRLAVGDAVAFAAAARASGVRVPDDEPWDDVFNRVHLELLEPQLSGAVFLYEYPVEQAVLARRSPESPRYAERFELFVDGLELCNGFGELTDPVEQRERFESEQAQRRALGRPVYPIDEDFLTALATMPEAAGNALGIDRLVMLALGEKAIDRVMAFSTGRLFR